MKIRVGFEMIYDFPQPTPLIAVLARILRGRPTSSCPITSPTALRYPSRKGGKERNDRIFAVPDHAPFEGDLQDVRHLPARAVEELEKFFEATDALEDEKLEFLGWRAPTRANKTINRLSL